MYPVLSEFVPPPLLNHIIAYFINCKQLMLHSGRILICSIFKFIFPWIFCLMCSVINLWWALGVSGQLYLCVSYWQHHNHISTSIIKKSILLAIGIPGTICRWQRIRFWPASISRICNVVRFLIVFYINFLQARIHSQYSYTSC